MTWPTLWNHFNFSSISLKGGVGSVWPAVCLSALLLLMSIIIIFGSRLLLYPQRRAISFLPFTQNEMFCLFPLFCIIRTQTRMPLPCFSPKPTLPFPPAPGSEVRQELDEEGSRCLLLSRQHCFNQRCCIRCCSPFTFLLNPKRRCQDCLYNVCKACRVYSKEDNAWLCSACQKCR